jgi:hypothetical protein
MGKRERGSWPFGRTLWAWGFLLGLVTCISPTIPPDDPPAPDEIELGMGTARLSGHVGEGPAFVFVHNRATDLVFGQRTPTGAYEFEVDAAPCDELALWYTVGAFQSSAIVFLPAEIAERPGACAATGSAGMPLEDAGTELPAP